MMLIWAADSRNDAYTIASFLSLSFFINKHLLSIYYVQVIIQDAAL